MLNDTIHATCSAQAATRELIARQADELGVTMGQVFTEAVSYYLKVVKDGSAQARAR